MRGRRRRSGDRARPRVPRTEPRAWSSWRAAGAAQPPAADSLNEGESTGLDPASLTEGRERVLGGTTALWAGPVPARPSRARSTRATGCPHSGWPFDEQRAGAVLQPRGGALRDRGRGLRRARLGRLRRGASRDRPEPARPPLHGLVPAAAPRPALPQRAGRARTTCACCCTRPRPRLRSARPAIASSRCACAAPGGKTARVRARACVLCGRRRGERPAAARLQDGTAGSATHDLVGRFFQDHPNGHCAVDRRAATWPASRSSTACSTAGACDTCRASCWRPRSSVRSGCSTCAAYPVFHFGEESGDRGSPARLPRAAGGRRRPERSSRELGRIARDAPRLAPVGVPARGARPRRPRARRSASRCRSTPSRPRTRTAG